MSLSFRLNFLNVGSIGFPQAVISFVPFKDLKSQGYLMKGMVFTVPFFISGL
jgi:hypothetical protein